jgi:hypothetical protein
MQVGPAVSAHTNIKLYGWTGVNPEPIIKTSNPNITFHQKPIDVSDTLHVLLTTQPPKMAATQQLNDDLDVAQSSYLFKLYTQICFIYPVSDASLHHSIINTLESGLQRLSASFPWVAGQVVNEASEGSPPVFKIRPLAESPRLIVKDYTNDLSIPNMEALRAANFPSRMLDESIIAPRPTLAGAFGAPTDHAEILILQANFIKGGLLLTINGQHNVVDGVGQGAVMDLLSKACGSEPFTAEELSSGNLAPIGSVIPLLEDSYTPGPELDYQIKKPSSSDSGSTGIDNDGLQPSVPPKCSWVYFTFSASSLAKLKALTMGTVTEGYITTDDALTALIWQATMRARRPRYESTVEATIARAVDVRRFMGVSSTYAGILQNMTYHTYKLQALLEEPVGGLASNLRAPLNPKTSKLAYNTRALATVMARSKDTSSIGPTITLDLPKDIMLSSWSKLNCYTMDFNLGLGNPECVRRPQFTPCESLMYLMPKALDGGIAAAVCLREEDMERLKADKEFVKYGTFVG